jgi:hypothetical protein
MQSLQEAIGRELRWKPRSAFSRTYDLVDPQADGGTPFATLVWRPGLLMGGPAEARSGDGCWRFRRRGFLRGRVFVMPEEGESPLATLREHWRHGRMRFEDGREFIWRRESLWGLAWRFEDANGTPVVRIRRALWPPAGAARVEIESSAAEAGDRALLACLGWYLVVLDHIRHVAHAGS